FGQTVFPETLTLDNDFTLIAYFFKPYSLFTLFGLSARELTDNPIDLNLLEPTVTSDLQDRLLNADSTERMITLIDNYIFSLIKKVKTETQMIKYATKKITEKPRKRILQKVQNELYLTERTFQRMFKKHIGI